MNAEEQQKLERKLYHAARAAINPAISRSKREEARQNFMEWNQAYANLTNRRFSYRSYEISNCGSHPADDLLERARTNGTSFPEIDNN